MTVRLLARAFPLMCIHGLAAAQSPLPPLEEYHIRAFGPAAGGLLASSVRDIVQAPDGYLYLAQARGLVRYNGYRFSLVPLPGLNSGFVDDLHVDGRGRLWVRTRGGDLGYLENGQFRLLPHPPAMVHEFWETPDGLLWLGSDSGVVRVEPEAAAPYTQIGVPQGLPDARVYGVFDVSGRDRVIVTTQGLARLQPDAAGARVIPFGPRCVVAADVRFDAHGLWLPCRVHGAGYAAIRYHEGRFESYASKGSRLLHLADFDLKAGTPARFHPDRTGWAVEFQPPGVTGFAEYTLAQALLDRAGNRWLSLRKLGTARDELMRLVGDRFETIPLRGHIDFSQIDHLIEDHEGSIWVATDRGLFQLSPRRLFALGQHHGLTEGFTTAVLQTRDGAVWIGSWGGGLHRFANGRLEQHLTTAAGLPNNHVRALFEDDEGVVWVGMAEGFAAVRAGRVILRRSIRGEVRAFALTRDAADPDRRTIWIGTTNHLLRRTGDAMTEFKPGFWRGKEIWAMHTDRAGALWIGSEGGLFRLRVDSLRSFGEADGLRSPFVVAIAEQHDGALWFSTYEHGLHRYRNHRFTPITTREGLYANGVWRMLDDGSGGTWLSSDIGIFRVDSAGLRATADAIERGEKPALLRSVLFTEAEGMPSRESNRASPGGIRLRDGRLLFNNLEGVIVFDPRSAVVSPPPPPTRIEAVAADGNRLDAQADRIFKVPAGTRQLAFDFAALSFATPEQNRYRYRLDGYDDDWVEAGTRRTASYTNLAPGPYTFRVQGATATGEWSSANQLYAFTVAPALWQTWWFRILAVTLLAALLVTAYRYRVSRLLEMERLRLRIASDLHDNVGSNLSSIALLSGMLRGRTRLDDVEQRQMHRINQAAEETIGALRDIIWLVDPQHADINDLVRKMRSTASDLVNGTTCTFDAPALPPRQLGMSFMRDVLLLYKEAVHNAVRHARASQVTVSVRDDDGKFVLQVQDDGIGFDRDRIRPGRGLENMRRRARQAGGTIDIASDNGTGTRITFKAPMA